MSELFKVPQTPTTLFNHTPDQALLAYKGGDAWVINDSLRRGVELDDFNKSIVRGLDKKLDSLPRYSEPTFRSYTFTDREELEEFVKMHQAGKTVEYPAYTSSAKTPYAYHQPNGSGMQALIKINGRSGRDMASIEEGSNAEQEVLFGRNSRFKVKRFGYSPQAKTYFGEMDEI